MGRNGNGDQRFPLHSIFHRSTMLFSPRLSIHVMFVTAHDLCPIEGDSLVVSSKFDSRFDRPPFPFDNTHLSPPYHAPWYANSTSLCYTFEPSSIRKRCLLSKTERWITNFPSHPPWSIRTNRTQNPISVFRSGTSPRLHTVPFSR